MKILLFNPPTPEGKRFIREGRCTQEEGAWGTLWPPLSLATAAAVLERAKHDVKLRDFPAEGSDFKELEKLLKSWMPQIAIWSSATPSFNSDLDLAATLKGILSTMTTCTFGTHVGTLIDDCFKAYPSLDFIIRGEPELSVQDLADALEGKRSLPSVPGIAFRDEKKTVVITEPRALPKNLDDMPDPAWHLLNLNSYTLPLKGRKFLMVVPTRGCPYACSFCTTHSYYGNNLRRRSPLRVVAEIRRNVESFGVKDFLFWSDTFTLDRAYVKDLCKAILDSKLDISWACNSRVDTADFETFKMMKQAGCWMVSYGIESGSQEVLDLSKKGASIEDVSKAVRWTKSAGLMATGHFVLGLPGDTPTSIQETIDFSMTLGLDFAQYYCAVPFPGSVLYTEAKKNGWLKVVPWEDFRQDNALLQLPGLPPEIVEKLRNQAYQRFYSNPKTWLSKIQLIRPAAIPKMFSTLKSVLGWRHSLPDSTA